MKDDSNQRPERRSVARLMSLRGKRVLVTGGAGHVGELAAETYAELGAEVALLDRDAPRLEAVAERLHDRFGRRVETVVLDLETDRPSPERIERLLGGGDQRLDLLVNAAAFVGSRDLPGWAVPFERQSVETWRRALEVNLTAPFALVQAAVRLLAASKGAGAVINVSSIYGRSGPVPALYEGTEMGNPAAYAASKGGLEQLTRWLATTLAPRVRVNAIAPGGIERGQPEPFQQRYRERTPMGRLAVEEDLKGAFAYLGSDLSAYVTGQVLVVDGGWLAW